jgi:hypothetical protein
LSPRLNDLFDLGTAVQPQEMKCESVAVTITVAHEDSPDKLTVVQTITTQRGARTMALDPKNHNVYTVTADFGPPPPATPQNPHPWPKVISKTFTLLIFGQ